MSGLAGPIELSGLTVTGVPIDVSGPTGVAGVPRVGFGVAGLIGVAGLAGQPVMTGLVEIGYGVAEMDGVAEYNIASCLTILMLAEAHLVPVLVCLGPVLVGYSDVRHDAVFQFLVSSTLGALPVWQVRCFLDS